MADPEWLRHYNQAFYRMNMRHDINYGDQIWLDTDDEIEMKSTTATRSPKDDEIEMKSTTATRSATDDEDEMTSGPRGYRRGASFGGYRRRARKEWDRVTCTRHTPLLPSTPR